MVAATSQGYGKELDAARFNEAASENAVQTFA